jgi:hypothetical protein
MIDIIYCRLSYVFRCVLLLKTLILYIYRSRDTMQYNQQLYAIYSSNTFTNATKPHCRRWVLIPVWPTFWCPGLWCHTFATCGHFGVRRTIDNPQLHTKYICIHSLLNSQSLGVIKRPLSVLSRAGYNFRHHFCFMLRRCSFELLQFVRFEMHNKLRCWSELVL